MRTKGPLFLFVLLITGSYLFACATGGDGDDDSRTIYDDDENSDIPDGGNGDDDDDSVDADDDTVDGGIVSNRDGTVSDLGTNLMWVKDASTAGKRLYVEAGPYCENLELAGYDDWRLPTISELRTLLRGCYKTVMGGSCGVDDSCLEWPICRDATCGGCQSNDGPDAGCYWPSLLEGPCHYYWTDSIIVDGPSDDEVYVIQFGLAKIQEGPTFATCYDFVRCTRDLN